MPGILTNLNFRVWDVRKLNNISPSSIAQSDSTKDQDSNMRKTLDFDLDDVNNFVESAKGKGILRGEYEHKKSASSAYWDPRGRQILSTSYDDTLRRMLVSLFKNFS